jgi:eukaryotic-like serine/threonine-protein kinase
MSNYRGIAFLAAIKYIKQNYKEEGFTKVIESLSPEDKDVVMGKLNPVTLYPMKAYINLLSAADKIFGQGDYALCSDIGRFEADETFSGLYKVFLEVGNPNAVIRKASLAWRTLHDAGDLEIEQTSDKFVRGKVTNFPDYHKAFCNVMFGYFAKVLEMSGAKDLAVKEVKCRVNGDDCCEFELTWA